MGWEVTAIPQPLLPPGKIPVTHCTGGWVGLGATLDRYRLSRPHGVQTLDCPAHSYHNNYAILAFKNYFSSHKPQFPRRPYPFQLQ